MIKGSTLVIREMQAKATLKCHSSFNRQKCSNYKTDKYQGWVSVRSNRDAVHSWWGCSPAASRRAVT